MKEQTTLNMENDENKVIVMLPTSRLFPHPQNPRRDVGDISELCDSIRAQGVLQNLTVVPAVNRITGKEFEEGEAGYGDYTVIIGHRRLAAAKMAGVKLVPCVIANLSESEQQRIMLSENMQRSDLTPYEQALGMQLLIDLGDSTEDIARGTGLSEKTVKGRLKIAQIKSEALSEACRGKQITVDELLKLAEIKNESRREALIRNLGSSNFDYLHKQAKDEELTKERLEKNEPLVAKFAEKISIKEAQEKKYVWFASYAFFSWVTELPKIVIPQVLTFKYYYTIDGARITIYREKTAEELANEEKKANERNENAERERRAHEKADEINRRMYSLRRDFVLSLLNKPMTPENESRCYTEYFNFLKKNDGYYKNFRYYSGLQEMGLIPDVCDGDIEKFIRKAKNIPLILAYLSFEDSEQREYIDYNYNSYELISRENKLLDALYDFLCDLGYEMSEFEEAAQKGAMTMFNLD